MSPKIAHKQTNPEISVTRSFKEIPPFSGIRRIIRPIFRDPSPVGSKHSDINPKGCGTGRCCEPPKPMEKSRFWATFLKRRWQFTIKKNSKNQVNLP